MDCIFCKITKKEMEATCLYEDDLVMVIKDAYPNVEGHSLIIPKKHYEDYLELDDNMIKHMMQVAKEWGPKLMEEVKATSVTLLINYGEEQKVKHVHLHLLPDFGKRKK